MNKKTAMTGEHGHEECQDKKTGLLLRHENRKTVGQKIRKTVRAGKQKDCQGMLIAAIFTWRKILSMVISILQGKISALKSAALSNICLKYWPDRLSTK